MEEIYASEYVLFSEEKITYKIETLIDYAKAHNLLVLCIKEKWNGLESPTFMDILLDETCSDGILLVKSTLLKQTGTINRKLKSKQLYEWLIRLSKMAEVKILEVKIIETWVREKTENQTEAASQTVTENQAEAASQAVTENQTEVASQAVTANQAEVASQAVTENQAEAASQTEIDTENQSLEEWMEPLKTDCYIIGKYKKELLKSGNFNGAVEEILKAAAVFHIQEKMTQWLEQMLSEQEEYHKIDQNTCPILLYKGDAVCYNILNIFAEEFAKALEKKGQRIEIFDVEKDGIGEIVRYIGRRFKAVIGVQSYVFSVKMKNETEYVNNLILGPKYNFVFDHPLWMKPHLECDVKDYHILVLDKNYKIFTEKYYQKDAVFFPPAGMFPKEREEKEKKYRFSFVGTWGSYREELKIIRELDDGKRFLANRFLLIMKKNPNMTAEEAFHQGLSYYGIDAEEKFISIMHEFRRVVYCMIHYYREKTVRTLLDAGISLDVFGDSWEGASFCQHKNLICHPSVTVEEGIEIMRESELTLNVMSWHKAGFTERIANGMLGKTVVVTDKTDYLIEEFEDGKDIILFDLEALEELPNRVKEILQNKEQQKQITERAYQKAVAHHTWGKRAEDFLELLECKEEYKSVK
ncbi:MAG: glycosyltransferase [Lachnospiraceae bacterium]